MVEREARTLARDVEVAAIPYGDKLTLTAGTTVHLYSESAGTDHRVFEPGFDITGTQLMTASTAQVYPGITSWNSAVTLAEEAATHALARIKKGRSGILPDVFGILPKTSVAVCA